MKGKVDHSAAAFFCAMAAASPAMGQEFVENQEMSRATGMQVYEVHEDRLNDILVKPQLGLKSMMKEISLKVSIAGKIRAFSSHNCIEFQNRVDRIAAKISECESTSDCLERRRQLLSCASQLSGLSNEINEELRPFVASVLCSDGSCLARTPEGLHNQVKELSKNIKDKLAAGILSDELAKKYKRDAKRLFYMGIAQGGDIHLSSKSLQKLAYLLNSQALAISLSTGREFKQ